MFVDRAVNKIRMLLEGYLVLAPSGPRERERSISRVCWPTASGEPAYGRSVQKSAKNSSGDFIALRPYSGGSTPSDGICAFSTGSCYSLTPSTTNGVLGAAIDGNGTLWMTEPGDGGVLYAPQVTSSAPFYTTTSIVAANELLHNSTNGATMTSPAGIAIDTAGDVWVSNAGCTASGCTPVSFTLSEIIGAAAPTITPVVQQIITNSTLTSTKPSY